MPTLQEGAKTAAEAMLVTAWHGDQHLPVDPIRIARRLGIDVHATILDPTVSGAIVKEPGRDPSILLSESDSPNRQRFTCAHEIGHFVRRSGATNEATEFEYVDLRAVLAAEGTNDEEIFANAFAANLLMPERRVREFHDRGLSAVQMSLEFDVSVDAVTFRLKNLGLAS